MSTLLEAAASTQESSPAVSHQVLARARYQIHETIEEARRSVWNLRHQDFTHNDLVVSLLELTEHMSHDALVKLTCECESKRVVVDERSHHEILQIAREAASNALQHAHASMVTLHLSANERSIALSAQDWRNAYHDEHTRRRYLCFRARAAPWKAVCDVSEVQWYTRRIIRFAY